MMNKVWLLVCMGCVSFSASFGASMARAEAASASEAGSAAAADMVASVEVDTPRLPHEVIDKTSKDLLSLIDGARDYVEEDRERFFDEVTELLEPTIDFKSFARSVMSKFYKQADETQRQRFAERFKRSLVRTYSLALLEFKDGNVVVLPPDAPARNPKRQSVKMEIRTASGSVYPVIYTMALGKDTNWRMRNIIINGINIGLTYRSQFAGAMSEHKNDLDKVIDVWAGVVASDDATS